MDFKNCEIAVKNHGPRLVHFVHLIIRFRGFNHHLYGIKIGVFTLYFYTWLHSQNSEELHT